MSQKNKHTPGPWKLGKHGSIIVDAPPSDDPDGVVQFYGGNVICESLASVEDARLIAAAPEMFSELEKVIEGCEICEDTGFIEYQPSGIDGFLPTGDANFVVEPCPNCFGARVVVAKVKGETWPE